MNKLRAITLSTMAVATFAGSSSSSPEQITQASTLQPEHSPVVKTADIKYAAACAALGELRGILGSGDPEPLGMFSNGEDVFGKIVFLPQEVQMQADDVEAALLIDKDAVRSDRLGIDGLAAITTSRLAAEATDDVLERFEEYKDPLEAAAVIDQAEASAYIIQARQATSAALQNNCR